MPSEKAQEPQAPSGGERRTGRVDVLDDGNVYLRLEQAGAHRGHDVRIPRRRVPDSVIHGDTVEAEVRVRERDGREEVSARIVRILARDAREFEGRFETRGRHGFVVPDDPIARRLIWVNPQHYGGAVGGDRVRARLQPLDPEDPRPEARIVEVLSSEGVLDRVLRKVVEERGIQQEFPAPVVAAAQRLPAAEFASEPGVVDLRGKAFATIDGVHARDFDDALCVWRDGEGFAALVAVADVARYVRSGDEIDGEAVRRGTSVYFPQAVYPMLPERLSNDLCSLVPDQDRPVLVVRLHFNAHGVRTGAQLLRAWLRSKARLTYTQVNAYLEDGDDEAVATVPRDVRKMLHHLRDLAECRIARRRERGALDFDLPEPEFVVGLAGEVSEILHSERRIAHRAVEELMIAANEAVAEILSGAGLPVMYRCHPQPPPDRYEMFVKFAHHLGLRMPRQPTPEAFYRIVAAVDGTPYERAVQVLVLRTMAQAEYSLDNVGHFGLALDHYAHFTSPIRRYPDLYNHRWALHFLQRGGLSSKRADEIAAGAQALAKQLSERERMAEQAERTFVKTLKARFMEDRIGERFEGVVAGVAKFGVFVELKEYLVEGLIPVRELGNDYFVHDDVRMEMRGRNSKQRFRLGDLVEVELVSVQVEKGFIDFRLISHHPLS